MEIHSNEVKRQHQAAKKHHRHILCLYGDDEKLLRLAAMQLKITVSHLIRISLYWFLPKLENQQVTWSQIFYHGTKICRNLDITRKNMLNLPFYDVIFYAKWPPELWWGHQRYTIPIPYTPEIWEDEFFKKS